jgi:hypothetical protein
MEELYMNIRKVLAGSMAAIAAGATVAFGAFAQSSGLGDYVDTSGSTPVPPWIILGSGNGSPDYAKDVLGAADVAAGTAGFVTMTQSTGGAAEVSVSGGVSLSTSNTKLFGGDAISTAKDTLTEADLPTILASGEFEDDNGDAFEYDQYIVVGGSLIALSNSNDDEFLNEDPADIIDIGTNSGAPAYTWRVVFKDDLNFSDSDVDGNELEMFGTSFTISADSDTDTLVLFGGANKQTLTEGETTTIEVASVSYDVTLLGVSDEDTIVLKVNDISRTIDEGQSRTIANLEVFVDDVFFLSKENQVSSAQVTFGSQELTLDNNDEVSVGSGTDQEDIDNTLVTFTQGTDGTSVLEVGVAAPDNDGDFASATRDFVDPVFGTVKLAFGAGTPDVAMALYEGEPTSDVEMFEFDTSGDDTASVRFTAYLETTPKTIEWSYDSDTNSQTNSLQLSDSDENAIFVFEGVNMTEDDFFVVNQDDFAHLFEITDIDTNTGDANDGKINIKDVFDGSTYEIDMTETGTDSGIFNGTDVIDGKTYVFWSSDQSTDVMAVVWGTGATAPASGADGGAEISVFPTIVTTLEAELAFINNVTIGASLNASKTIELLGISDSLAAGTQELTGTSINFTYDWQAGWLSLETVSGPAVAILEEEGEDISENDVQNAVIVEAGQNADGITIETSGSPEFTDDLADAVGFISTSDSDIDVAGDRYGIFVKRDADDQGTVEVYYPDTQIIYAVGIGADPRFSVSGEAGTVDVAYQITSPVAKLASEITNPASLNRDVIIFGGPCANSLVATLMDVSTAWPDCFADFENLNEGMIKEYDDAFGSGQKALVIAGVTGDDTRNLAARALTDTSDYSA